MKIGKASPSRENGHIILPLPPAAMVALLGPFFKVHRIYALSSSSDAFLPVFVCGLLLRPQFVCLGRDIRFASLFRSGGLLWSVGLSPWSSYCWDLRENRSSIFMIALPVAFLSFICRSGWRCCFRVGYVLVCLGIFLVPFLVRCFGLGLPWMQGYKRGSNHVFKRSGRAAKASSGAAPAGGAACGGPKAVGPSQLLWKRFVFSGSILWGAGSRLTPAGGSLLGGGGFPYVSGASIVAARCVYAFRF